MLYDVLRNADREGRCILPEKKKNKIWKNVTMITKSQQKCYSKYEENVND